MAREDGGGGVGVRVQSVSMKGPAGAVDSTVYMGSVYTGVRKCHVSDSGSGMGTRR